MALGGQLSANQARSKNTDIRAISVDLLNQSPIVLIYLERLNRSIGDPFAARSTPIPFVGGHLSAPLIAHHLATLASNMLF